MYSEDELKKLGAELHLVVAAMIGHDLRDENLPHSEKICPFDIDRENLHKSKGDFLAEITFVRNWLAQIEKMAVVLHRDMKPAAYNDDMDDLVEYLNGWARAHTKYIEVNSAQELAVSNVMQTGFVSGFLMLNQHCQKLLSDRLEVLERQEKDFWNVAHRPPNYHARTIAVRLAQLFARETGRYPTIGTRADSNDPSTDYSRALAQTYKILSIGADFRGPAEWAISQLSDKDLVRRKDMVDPFKVLREVAAAGYLKK